MIPVVERSAARQKPVEPTTPPAVWQKYVGLYERASVQAEIKLVNDGLVLVAPRSPWIPDTELIPDGEHTFRTKDGYFKGELVVFESDAAGNIIGMRYADRSFKRK